ncbi:uncharacterized protein [Haliotis asinina]|uniref:uncharacterized protein n=1 Tax=Haliotis asinina TaxID=109174 RepID=UPI003532572A
MDSGEVNSVISPTKKRRCECHESSWPQTNHSPRVENMPSLNAEAVDPISPSSQTPSTTSSVPRTDASSCPTSTAPHGIMAVAGTSTLQRIQPLVSCNKTEPSGRKRKMSDRQTEEEKKERTNERKCRRNHVQTRTTAPTNTKKASRDTMETDAMKYWKMLGYNVVPDYNNYLVVRSAFGYGNISRSSSITRSPESQHHLCHQDNSFEKTHKVTTLRDKVNQLVRNGGCPRHNTRSDPNNYLVVQSVYGYGSISQSSSIKREGVHFMHSDSSRPNIYMK